jgi:GxxExxY protein
MVEVKALTALEEVHLAQAMNYYQAYHLPVGLLINFGARSLEFKRVYNLNHAENRNSQSHES